MEGQQPYMIVGIAIVLFIALCWKFSGTETFVTPKSRAIPGYTGKIKHKRHIPTRSNVVEPKTTKKIIGPRPAQQIDLVQSPAIAHRGDGTIGKECHALCDEDGTCHSRAFFECLQRDPSRFGTIGRERNAYNSAFRRISYDTLISVPRT